MARPADRTLAPVATTVAAPALPATHRVPWHERLLDWAIGVQASAGFQRWAARFPLTRPVALRRSRAVFDLCAGFVYSQTLVACVRLDLFTILAEGSQTAAALARRTGLTVEAAERLLAAACAVRLVARRSGARYALGALGAPLVGNAALTSLIAHHALLYDDLRDPVALLRDARRRDTSLARYYPYAAAAERSDCLPAEQVADYSGLMAAMVPPLAAEVLDAYDAGRHRCLLDVGGGEGAFVAAVAARHPALELMLFDLPAVVARAEERLLGGPAARTRCWGGNFHTDPLPTGADLVTLVRILLDHDDETALRLLRRVRAALAPGGVLLIAEPFAGARGAESVGDAYFGFYLLAMGRGRARRASEYQAMLAAAGFSRSRRARTRYPVQTGLIVADR